MAQDDCYVFARFNEYVEGNEVQFSSGNPEKERESVIQLRSWSWDFGDGITSTQEQPFHTYNLPGDYLVTLNYSVTWEDGVQCQDTYSHVIHIACPADIDHNGFVNTSDLLRLLAQFGQSCGGNQM